MADLNALIAQGAQFRPPPDPFAQYAQMQQLQQGQQANQLNQLKMQEYQRESAATNALNQAYQAAYNPATGAYDMGKLRGAVIGAGAGAKLPGIEEGMSKLRTQQLSQSKAEAEAVTQKLAQSRALLDTIDPADPSAPQRFMAWHEANHTDPVLGPVLQRVGATAEQSRASIVQAIEQGPAALADLIAKSREGQFKFAERFKPITVAAGASVYRPGDTEAMFTAPAAAPKSTLMTPEEEAQRIRIARESRPPAQPRAESPPVAVVDDTTGKIKYVTREQAMGKTPAAAIESLPPKEIQKREAAFPQATTSVKSVETNADTFVKQLKTLRDHPGLEGITGFVYGRTPGVTGASREAQALYDQVQAKGGFQMLQAMREASKTGGALGNVSNEEGRRLQSSFAAIDRVQDAGSVRNAIDLAIADIEGAKARSREAYESTYSYKQGGGNAPAAPAKPSGWGKAVAE